LIPGIKEIVEMLLAGSIKKAQAIAWLEEHAQEQVEKEQFLRDMFAGLAMMGIAGTPAVVARDSYAQADEMMKARK
jgi:hypothetical protein